MPPALTIRWAPLHLPDGREPCLSAPAAPLRRIAGLVARGAASAEVYAAIAREVGHVIGLPLVTVWRYESRGTATVLGAWSERPHPFQVCSRWPLDGPTICAQVLNTGRAARIDDIAHLAGTLTDAARQAGVRSCVAAPIIVDGEVWGAMSTDSTDPAPLPDQIEDRLAAFTELVGTAIASIQARSDLAACRARMVAAVHAERRRVVRDLHDGAQQRLIHTVVTLKLARQALHKNAGDAPALLTEALEQAEQAAIEVRELAHGVLPSALKLGGLRAGVEALASRVPVAVDNGVSVGRLPAAVEATAYFVVSEALTNVAKHAGAARAAITARVEDGTLQVRVRDDGAGGARPDGSGLQGLADRLAAMDGRLHVESPADGGTLVGADIPIRD